jgi:fluoride exporter
VTPRRHVAIALGGAAGAGIRWGVGAVMGPGAGFPWATFAVNVAGCLLLGVLLAEEWHRFRWLLHDGGGVGFCGGLTTFSTFAVEAADLVDRGRPLLAAGYLGASLGAGLAAYVAAGVALRRVRALALPVEGEGGPVDPPRGRAAP